MLFKDVANKSENTIFKTKKIEQENFPLIILIYRISTTLAVSDLSITYYSGYFSKVG